MNTTTSRTRTYDWQAPITSWDALRDLDGKAYLQTILDGQQVESPMSQTLDLHLEKIDDGYAMYTIEPSEYHYNPIGSVHGGVTATLFDTTLSSAIITQLPAGKVSATVELHVHYLRAVTTRTGRLQCEAQTIHVGRTLATAEGKLIGADDGKIYAHATLTAVVQPVPQRDLVLPAPHDTRTFAWDDPMICARLATQMDGTKFLKAMVNSEIPPPPIVLTLGMTGPQHVEEGRVRFGANLGGWLMNTSGVIHGGLTATLCDSALGCAIHTQMQQGMGYTTTELNVNYVRPIKPTTPRLYADATTLHVGRQIATAECKVIDDEGTLYAHATTTCLVFPVG